METRLADRDAEEGEEVTDKALREAAQFKREDRFIVLKRADLLPALDEDEFHQLESICRSVQSYRRQAGKPIHSYVVVADDWPEYETVWAMIERRVTNEAEANKAALDLASYGTSFVKVQHVPLDAALAAPEPEGFIPSIADDRGHLKELINLRARCERLEAALEDGIELARLIQRIEAGNLPVDDDQWTSGVRVAAQVLRADALRGK